MSSSAIERKAAERRGRVLREHDDLAGAAARPRLDDRFGRIVREPRQRRKQVLEDRDLPGARGHLGRRGRVRRHGAAGSIPAAAGTCGAGGERHTRSTRRAADASAGASSPQPAARSGSARRARRESAGARRASSERPSGFGEVRLEHGSATSALATLVATSPLRPSTPMMFGNTCRAFIRSPQAQTSSTFVIAPNGISRQ